MTKEISEPALSKDAEKGFLLILFAALAWGSSFPVIKWGLGFINPLLFLTFRFLLACLVMIPFVNNSDGQINRLFKNKFVIGLSVLNSAGYILEFTGLIFTTASKASLLVNVNVVLVALFSTLLLRERLGKRKLIALILGLAGVAIITLDGDLSNLFTGSLIGDIMVVSAGVVWALYIVYSRKIVVSGNPGIDVGSVNLSWAIIILTTIIFSPAAAVYVLFEPTQLLGLLSFEAVFAIIYLGVVCTTIAFTLYFKGLKYVSASSTALILLSEIVFAIVLSSILLVEPVTVYIIIGGLLISSAIILLRKS